MTSTQPAAPKKNNTLAHPFARIFLDRAEADWAFDLFRDTVKRLQAGGAYDPRLAVTLSERSGKLFLRLNFGSWLVFGIRGPGQSSERIDMALLAERIAWDERFAPFSFERKEGRPEVRTYELPIDTVRPLTRDLQSAYETTLDLIAGKFQNWKKATHWKQHNPELVEAFFDPDRRARLFAEGLDEIEVPYERYYTAFGQELVLAEERAGYEAEAKAEVEAKGETEVEMMGDEHVLIEPFSEIFTGWAEAIWAFDLIRETCQQLGLTANDPRLTVSMVERFGGVSLHVNFYDWLLLAFRPPALAQKRVRLPLPVDQAPFGNSFIEYEFEQPPDEPPIAAYGLPLDKVQSPPTELQVAYQTTLQHIARRFEAVPPPTTPNPHHRPDIAAAIFDSNLRVALMSEAEITEPDTQSPISHSPISQSPISQSPNLQSPPYPLSQLAADTHLPESDLTRWLRAIERKGQMILYGPPGTGKTYVAEKLAQHLTGGGDGFIELVQFHPAYAYEDFIQGLRPQPLPEGGLAYPLVPGRFLQFCHKADRRQDVCVLIIDEINRADLARVFGELMYLLEYRDREIPLAGGDQLKIPRNVRLIGTMNTADRSIALVDHALRRRFAFAALYPNFDILRRYHQKQQTGVAVEGLIKLLIRLNQAIGDAHYAIGVTFFLRESLADEIEDIWRMEIEPYLEEYFFDRPDTVDEFRWERIKNDVTG